MLEKIFRDPIYEYITVTQQELCLIDSPWFQRLRHCSQNGPARLVYPSLLGTRFEHSLGVMELGDRVFRSALDKSKHYDPRVVDRFLEQCVRDFAAFLGRDIEPQHAEPEVLQLLRMACLCHDLGHFPLSHTFEQAFEQEFWLDAIPQYWLNKRSCHEAVSAEILRQLAYDFEPDLIDDWLARGAILVLLAPPDVSAEHEGVSIRFGESVFSALSSILMGDYDVDRLDYLQRDGRISGAGFGEIDLERFIKSMMLVESDGQFEVMPTSKALSTVETVLLERYKEYKWVVFHHKVALFNELTAEVARDILADSSIRAGLFSRFGDDSISPAAYREEMLGKLGKPAENLSPLNLYCGEKLGLGNGTYAINGQYFVKNDESYLLDDVWFCLKCRSICMADRAGKLYLQALVDRKKCGLTLWKDLTQFQRFHNACTGEATASEDLANLANRDAPDRFPDRASKWLQRLWATMREEEKFGEKTCDALARVIGAELWQVCPATVRLLIVLLRWSRLFGRLGNKRVLGRRGFPVSLLENSNLLSRLAGLEGEISFYLYAIGEENQVRKLKDEMSEDDLLQTTARGFIKGIVECWDDPATPEPKGAWLEVQPA